MGETLYTRCQRICGPASNNCFVNNSRQVTCLADMLVNKVYGLAAVLEMLRAEGVPESSRELLEESFQITDELINWVKFLQVSSDISKGVNSPDPERRDSIRYYGLGSLAGVTLETDFGSGPEQAEIVNFSQKGMQFVSAFAIDEGKPFRGELRSEQHGKSVAFEATVRYSATHDGKTIVGAAIEKVGKSADFNFFRSIMDLLEATRRAIMEKHQEPGD